MTCEHDRVYYSLERDSFYCADCKKGMGNDFYKHNYLQWRNFLPPESETYNSRRETYPFSLMKGLKDPTRIKVIASDFHIICCSLRKSARDASKALHDFDHMIERLNEIAGEGG